MKRNKMKKRIHECMKTYICICVYTCTYTYIYIYVYVCVYIYIFFFTSAFCVCLCVRKWLFVLSSAIRLIYVC